MTAKMEKEEIPVNKFRGKMCICPETGARRPLQDVMTERGDWEEKQRRDYEREIGEPLEETVEKTASVSSVKSLEQMSLEELKAEAKAYNVKIHPNVKNPSVIISKIKEASKKAKL